MKPLLPIPEESNLVVVIDNDHEFSLHPAAAEAWNRLKAAAAAADIDLSIVSAFRSVARQQEIIEHKRKQGIPDWEIFKVNAPAGFSEHHSGRAIDITTQGYTPLEEEFEQSKAFAWLCDNAAGHGFTLSYPRDNEYGIAYEPWHWLYKEL